MLSAIGKKRIILKALSHSNDVIPESATADIRNPCWIPASAGMTVFCSVPIYRRFCVSPNSTLRLSAQSLMNQAATFQFSAVSYRPSAKNEKNKKESATPAEGGLAMTGNTVSRSKLEVSSYLPLRGILFCHFGTQELCYFGTVFPDPLILTPSIPSYFGIV